MNLSVRALHSIFVLVLLVLAGAGPGSTVQAASSPVITSVIPPTAGPNSSLTITGTGFDSGSRVTVAGLALAVQELTSTRITATGTITSPPGAIAAVAVVNRSGLTSNIFAVPVNTANAVMSYRAAKHFLEQATWGPTPGSIAHLQTIGIDNWLNEQFDSLRTPISTYAAAPSADSGLQSLQSQFFRNAITGQDQLRQRIAFALSEIAVVSGYKLFTYQQIKGFEQMLLNEAFGKYGDFLKDVTLSPAMGLYLDMVNNDISYVNTPPNENYAREFMQLFTIGEKQLNSDGTAANGGALTYSEADVKAMAHVLTGWTYPRCDGASSSWPNPQCFTGQMVAMEDHHDKSPKDLLGRTIQAGSAEGDLDAALATIQTYTAVGQTTPNIAPFISLRLIQHLVKSNPSPAYVARISAAYVGSGGSLQQVARAVLTDAEARAGDSGPSGDVNDGHLREPVFVAISLLRALGATVSQAPPLADVAGLMGQELLYSPSVFNFYPAEYQMTQSGIVAPEFQTLNSSTAFVRANYILLILMNALSANDFHVDLTNFAALGSDIDPNRQTASLKVMLNAISGALLGSEMQPDMVNAIMPALTVTTDPEIRAITAVYLTAASGRYQVQY